MSDQPTRPSAETRAAERDEARTEAGADRVPTPEEDRLAESHDVDRNAAEHEKEMNERGANQQGEGKLP
jgi:hypothetical protein